MTIRLASTIQTDSIVDGEGIRTVIWTQGCPHKCPNCHNPSTHNPNGGFLMDVDNIKSEILSLKGQDGITLSGGEPFEQVEAVYEIAVFAKGLGLTVWCYSGYTFEKLLVMAKENNMYMKALQAIDVLIDGKFVDTLKSFNLMYRGSSNQRIINVKESLAKQEAVLIEKYNGQYKVNDLYVKPEHIFV
ncbi:MAG: anaerobic ribonucleoside-triphosphate reductase activating protein [Bacilli bacterium]|nr:anaerobic ribonucleoside-triphosphate reductase activating protein [Bacilli bacterium]